jgi:ABC-type antimicrobial peptide transport system permease subunit
MQKIAKKRNTLQLDSNVQGFLFYFSILWLGKFGIIYANQTKISNFGDSCFVAKW